MLEVAKGGRPANPPGIFIDGVPPEVALVSLHPTRPDGARRGSTSHSGFYLWVRPVGRTKVAGDLEGLDNPVAQRMADRFGVSTLMFLRFWTLLETVAKLERIPADVLLRRHADRLDAAHLATSYPSVDYATNEIESLVATAGWET